MTSARLILGLLVASLALVATACGGGSDSVPTGSVAVVNGTEISKAELQEYMELSKKGYERTNQTFPKAGTPEYQSVQARNLAYLVELVQLQQAAEDLGVKVTDADVDKLENQTIKSKFDGDRAEYEKALKKAGYTARAVPEDRLHVRRPLVEDLRCRDEGRRGDRPGDPRLLHREPDPVRHAGVARRSAHPHPGEEQGRVDATSRPARRRRTRCTRSWRAEPTSPTLAKQLSADPGSAKVGGKLTITRGQTVPEFDKAAFDLDTNELSKPVKTTYGYHLIEPLADIKEAKVQPFAKVKPAIKTTLLQQKRNEAIQSVGRGPEEGLRGQGQLRRGLRAAGGARSSHRDPVGSRR